MEMMNATTFLSQVPTATFHLGFLLSTAFVCAVLHLMIVVGEPDLTEEKERQTWLKAIGFLKWLMFLPLGFYNLEQVAFYTKGVPGFGPASSVELFLWFFGTVVVSGLLFTPIIHAIEAARLLNQKSKALPSEQVDYPLNAKASEDAKNEFKTTLTNAMKSPEVPANLTPATRSVEQHLRVILGNFSMGLIMGLSIIVPMVGMLFVTLILEAAGVITAIQRDTFLKFTPGITCFLTPLLMPFSFFVFGPSVLRITQAGRKIKNDATYGEIQNRFEKLLHGSKVTTQDIELHIVPTFESKAYAVPPAFLLGWPSRFSFVRKAFPAGIFLSEAVLKVMTKAEIEFILAHELAHYARKHAAKRILLTHALFVFSICVQVICLMFHAPMLALGAVAVSLAWGFHILRRQADLHEFEADLFALEHSQNPEDALTALQKLSLVFIPVTHTRRRSLMESRIQMLRVAVSSKVKPLDSSDSFPKDSGRDVA